MKLSRLSSSAVVLVVAFSITPAVSCRRAGEGEQATIPVLQRSPEIQRTSQGPKLDAGETLSSDAVESGAAIGRSVENPTPTPSGPWRPPPRPTPEPKELERLRKLVVPPAERLGMTVEVNDNIRARELFVVTIMLESTIEEDSFRQRAFSTRIFRPGIKKPITDDPPFDVGPRPGPLDDSVDKRGVRPILRDSVAVQFELFAGEAGSYVLEVEYFSEIGVRAVRRLPLRVLPAASKPSPEMQRRLDRPFCGWGCPSRK